jgi:hypothetical protein
MEHRTYQEGYKQALEDTKILAQAVELLENFAGSVGGSSSFWQEVHNDDYCCKVQDALRIVELNTKL